MRAELLFLLRRAQTFERDGGLSAGSDAQFPINRRELVAQRYLGNAKGRSDLNEQLTRLEIDQVGLA